MSQATATAQTYGISLADGVPDHYNKWREDLVKDIRLGDDRDGLDGNNGRFPEVPALAIHVTHPTLGITQTMTQCDINGIKTNFDRVKDTAKCIVEIGVDCNGSPTEMTSTRTLLDNKLNETFYFGIDLDDKSYLDDPEKNIYTIQTSSANVEQVMEFIRSKGITEIDFLFIDGHHSINAVLIEWEYTRYLSENAVVGFHDTATHPGPYMFLKYLNKDKWDVAENICPGNDWGIGFVSKKRKTMEHFYKNIQGWFGFPEIYTGAVAAAKNGAHFVEVGSWRGQSSAFMAVEIINSGKKIKFDCVDTWLGSANEESHVNDPSVINNTLYNDFINNMKPVEGYYTPIRMTSVEAAKLYEDASLDFVLIDGDHSYEAVRDDIAAWLPKVKPGGVIAGDDYGHIGEGSAGVKRAVHEAFGNDFTPIGISWFKQIPMNEDYAIRIIEAKNIVSEPAAADRLTMIFDVINFDEIKTVCEIGSRFLEQSLEMAHIFPEAKFHAFEPIPGSYQICCDNREKQANSVKDRISVYNLAVSNKTEEISFYEVDDTGSEHNVGASSKYKFIEGLNGSFFGKTWNQREIKVNAITLDEWREQNNIGPIDLIWIDAQGSELDAFKGAEKTLKDVKVIFSEVGIASYYQGQSLKPEIDAYLTSLGFRELPYGFKLNHPYEGDTIYIKA